MLNKQINASELKHLQSKVTMIDVREPFEYQAFHLEGSLPIPLSQFQVPEHLSKDTLIVTICAHGVRSLTARELLINAGFTNVFSLQGGLASFAAQP